jgi:hypothetical protein
MASMVGGGSVRPAGVVLLAGAGNGDDVHFSSSPDQNFPILGVRWMMRFIARAMPRHLLF